jgi:hypothetical protein
MRHSLSCTIFAICLSLNAASSTWAASQTEQPESSTVAQAPTPPQIPVDPNAGHSLQSSSASEQAIKQALASKTNLNLVDVPLKAAMDYIADKHHIQIHFDATAIKDLHLDLAKSQVSIVVKDVSLRSALDLILSEFGLAPVVKDEVLLITSRDKADNMLETRLYNVRDLIEFTGGTDLDGLADAIRQTVDPSSWDKVGGNGSLATFNNGGVAAFIIVQTQDNQDQVENLLSELRRLKPQRMIRQ